MRPTAHGLELHLTRIHQLVEEFKPEVVVVDSITSFLGMGEKAEVSSMIVRLIDLLKMKGITLFMTSLGGDAGALDLSSANISSVVDTWVLLRNPERDGGRVRTLSIVKSRGMAHSSATHEFTISIRGVALENGSPVIPATREATLVHAIDNLGGRLGSFDRIERALPDGETWSRFDRGIDSAAYFRYRAA